MWKVHTISRSRTPVGETVSNYFSTHICCNRNKCKPPRLDYMMILYNIPWSNRWRLVCLYLLLFFSIPLSSLIILGYCGLCCKSASRTFWLYFIYRIFATMCLKDLDMFWPWKQQLSEQSHLRVCSAAALELLIMFHFDHMWSLRPQKNLVSNLVFLVFI